MNYKEYKFSWKEVCIHFLIGLGICGLLGLLFYRHAAGIILLSPLIIRYLRQVKRKKKEDRAEQLKIEFQNAMRSLGTAMQAGYSAEQAVKRAIEDLSHQYGETDMIIQELYGMVHRLENNQTLEEVLLEFGERTGIEDIAEFAEVFATAKRSGGNVVKVMQATISNMEIKFKVQREIQTVLSGKQMEAKLMNIMPLGIILYLWISSPELLLPLYHNPAGVAIMTVALLVYLAAYMWSLRIVHITI